MVNARLLLLMMSSCLLSGAVSAQTWPTRVVRMVTGSVAGGGADITGRPIAQRMSELLKQQVIIDNRPGAAGLLANDLVAKAAPDGHTLLLTPGSFLIISSYLNARPPYDPLTLLTPATMIPSIRSRPPSPQSSPPMPSHRLAGEEPTVAAVPQIARGRVGEHARRRRARVATARSPWTARHPQRPRPRLGASARSLSRVRARTATSLWRSLPG